MVEHEDQGKREDIFSKAVRAGKRTYFFDVKATRSDQYYLTITESKRKFNADQGKFFYEKHKIFLYQEDFEKFMDGMKSAIGFIQAEQPAMQSVSKQAEISVEKKAAEVTFEDLGKEEIKSGD